MFNKLKSEIDSSQQYLDGKNLREAIEEWLQYYNETRIQLKLGGLSPVKFEIQSKKLRVA